MKRDELFRKATGLINEGNKLIKEGTGLVNKANELIKKANMCKGEKKPRIAGQGDKPSTPRPEPKPRPLKPGLKHGDFI